MVKKNNISYFIIILFILLTTSLVFYFDLYSFFKRHIWNEAKDRDNRAIVRTQNGLLSGKVLDVLDKKVFAFVGVKYAEPPVGDLRFKIPEPVRQWSDVRPVVEFTPMCPQVIIPNRIVEMNYISENISEDCLSLNIWTPDPKPHTLKTVMVWIHGGGFLYHSANTHEMDGRMMSALEDLVVVTINYRVGVFGFLNTRTEDAPGNMGIYDQSMALHWIKDNIVHFGGDPNKLVPFGESAGAISIGILMSFNMTKNLFSRAITQSGSFLLPQTSQTFANSKKFAKLVGCLHESDDQYLDSLTSESVECMRNTSFAKLYDASLKFLNKSYMPFMPSVDSYYEDISPPMDYIIEDDAYSNMKELLTGLVRNEGSFFVYILNPYLFTKNSYPELRTLKETRDMFVNLIKNKTDIKEELLHFIANQYITGPNSDSPQNNIQRLVDAFGNAVINCPTIFLADELVARNKSVYMYLYEHRPKSSQFGEWLGTSHYFEVPFVFGYPLRRPDLYSPEDIQFSKRIMKTWTHFAKTGKVLPQLNLDWPQFGHRNSFMVLNANKSSTIDGFNSEACNLYKSIAQLNG